MGKGKVLEELLRETCFLIKKVGRQVLKDYDLTSAQFEVLQKLYFNGKMRMSDISRELGVAKSTITGIVRGLESAGYVVKAKDPNDLRVNVLELTSRGKEIIEKVIARRQDFVSQCLKSLDIGITERLREDLNRLLDSIRKESKDWL
ncbi:MAG: MarR family transcriptional regulator, organic hydroperoxide resistance regulator [Thermotogota bacterium]|nr:MarR family transcriptional regulator, organic hydroperoxide resistance regulator [Thermotogota bacterium]MDK2865134.1 MarR family transcriptional regulator, organic hydroperoxide resistance regulator [Thermotogota bacterium]